MNSAHERLPIESAQSSTVKQRTVNRLDRQHGNNIPMNHLLTATTITVKLTKISAVMSSSQTELPRQKRKRETLVKKPLLSIFATEPPPNQVEALK
jgi:hypothetical protein